ncbi:MAG: DUF1549 domain-containing protein, partial [Planctomycetales bacterium]|nr:DUF1549 domain-containing protein [Planctomycetales bacterium]
MPDVANSRWGDSPLDRFVVAKLEESKLAPSPEADRRTLLRRAWFDLVGLPPPADDADRFERDESPDAYPRAVDRLLASPLYGQRWARHWLDVARYSDTKGYVFTEDRRYPYAYTYRNYVIASFNRDLPFDQFVVQQIAADKLELPPGERDALAAMGFLTVGRRFSNNIHDIIDDRIDVVTRGLLGLTVTCARCHDHKYDPIPSADYYSLYGVFASSVEPGDPPLIAPPEESEAYDAYVAELDKRQREHDEYQRTKHEEMLVGLRARTRDYLLHIASKDPEQQQALEADQSYNSDDLRPRVIKRWRDFLDAASTDDPVFGPWKRLSSLPPEQFAAAVGAMAASNGTSDSQSNDNRLVLAAIAERSPASIVELASVYGD